jgi:hypothetical protein
MGRAVWFCRSSLLRRLMSGFSAQTAAHGVSPQMSKFGPLTPGMLPSSVKMTVAHMRLRVRLLLILFYSLLMEVATASAQQNCSSSQTLAPPLGRWEVMDRQGGYGIDVDRVGIASGNGIYLAPPKASEVGIIVYRRRPADYCEDMHFFSLTWHCGLDKAATVTFKKNELFIHFPKMHFDRSTPIDVDLLFDLDTNMWKGNFRSGLFHDSHASLIQAPVIQKMLEPCMHQ